MTKRASLIVLALLAAVEAAIAQTPGLPVGAVPSGRGTNVTGWNQIVPPAVRGCITSTGALAQPSFGSTLSPECGPVIYANDITALRALTASAVNQLAYLKGYTTTGDGGEGWWWWDNASTAADNTGTVVRPASLPAAGRWIRFLAGDNKYSVRWFGAKASGVGNFSTELQNAADVAVAANGTLYFPRGDACYRGKITLSEKTDFAIVGDGPDLNLDGIGSCLQVEANNLSALTITSATSPATNSFTIADMRISGSGVGQHGIRLFNAGNFIIRNVTAVGQPAIGIFGSASWVLENVNTFGAPGLLLQGGSFPDSPGLTGNGPGTIIGGHLSNQGNCYQAPAVSIKGDQLSVNFINTYYNCFSTDGNGAATGTITNGGSGYTNGSYVGVPFTGGTGSGFRADVTVAGGAVTVVTIRRRGGAYTVSDTLTASSSFLGGTGSGLVYTVNTLGANQGGGSMEIDGPISNASTSVVLNNLHSESTYNNGNTLSDILVGDYVTAGNVVIQGGTFYGLGNGTNFANAWLRLARGGNVVVDGAVASRLGSGNGYNGGMVVIDSTWNGLYDFRSLNKTTVPTMYSDATALIASTYNGDASTVSTQQLAAVGLSRNLTTSIGANQNDYNPTGMSTAVALRVDGGAADRNITGLVPDFNGRVIAFVNSGTTNNITLVNESASSTAANRFTGGADIVVAPNKSTTLRYDGVSSRWRLLEATGAGGVSSAGLTGGVLGGAPAAYTRTPTIGASGATGTVTFAGGTSGLVTVQPQAVAGTYNFNLPTAAGTSGQPLLSGGGGATAQSYGTLGIAAGGTGVTAQPSFVANRTTNQTGVTSGSFQKAQNNNEVLDVTGAYDPTTNFRFTPQTAGVYLVTVRGAASAVTAGAQIYVAVHKNGTLHKAAASKNFSVGTTAVYANLTVPVIMNGSTDFIEMFIFQNTGANLDFLGDSGVEGMEFSAVRVGPSS